MDFTSSATNAYYSSQLPATDLSKSLRRYRQIDHLLGMTIPLARTLGFETTSVKPGHAVIEMQTNGDHYNPMGTLHGGILCTIADSAMGIAHASTLGEGETTTTLELKINFLRPVWEARLRAVGKVTKAGRTVSLVECEIFDEKDRLVAKASSTCMTLRGEDAVGRSLRS